MKSSSGAPADSNPVGKPQGKRQAASLEVLQDDPLPSINTYPATSGETPEHHLNVQTSAPRKVLCL
ncbi:MAG TPA: hypothetical protein DCE69_11105 [Sutterella wadsworthensis]|nr:hypothetical protein [Sutterella wadsworthensis]